MLVSDLFSCTWDNFSLIHCFTRNWNWLASRNPEFSKCRLTHKRSPEIFRDQNKVNRGLIENFYIGYPSVGQYCQSSCWASLSGHVLENGTHTSKQKALFLFFIQYKISRFISSIFIFILVLSLHTFILCCLVPRSAVYRKHGPHVARVTQNISPVIESKEQLVWECSCSAVYATAV